MEGSQPNEGRDRGFGRECLRIQCLWYVEFWQYLEWIVNYSGLRESNGSEHGFQELDE